MDSRELYKLRREIRTIDQLRDIIAELESLRISPRAAAYDGIRVNTSLKGDVQPENIAECDKRLKEYNKTLKAILARMAELENLIKPLREEQRQVIRAYFIQGKTWEQICVDLNLSHRQVMYIRKAALEIICSHSKSTPPA